jgi:RNA polymerase sigma factor (sigma-70 family)
MTEPDDDADAVDDGDLTAAARRGDGTAVAELYRRHIGAATALAASLTTRADTDDVASESFIRVMNALRAGRGPERAFRPYLMSAVRRQVIDQDHRAKAEDAREPADFDTVVHGNDFESAHATRDALRRVLTTLPERWRYAIWKLEVEGLKPRELAVELVISANSASALAYRARAGLRQAVEEHLDGCPDCRQRKAALMARDAGYTALGVPALVTLGPLMPSGGWKLGWYSPRRLRRALRSHPWILLLAGIAAACGAIALAGYVLAGGPTRQASGTRARRAPFRPRAQRPRRQQAEPLPHRPRQRRQTRPRP